MVYVKGTGNLGQRLRDNHRLVQDAQGLHRQRRPQGRRPADDHLHRDRRYRLHYEAAIPIAEAPKTTPHGDINVGQSPEGQALKFVHRGSYSDLDNTYEAITNYLDDKRMEAKDMFIEEYVTDPVTADADKLVVNVYVLIKAGQSCARLRVTALLTCPGRNAGIAPAKFRQPSGRHRAR